MSTITIPPKCNACNDTGEVKVRVQYHTPHGRSCREEMRPCPFCENGEAMDKKMAASPPGGGA